MWKEKNTYRHALIAPPPTFKVFEEQPYFCYHSNSPVSLSFSFLLFFPLKKRKKSITPSYSLSLVNITETPRLALHLLVQRGEGGRGAAHVSEGVVKTPGRGQYQEGPGPRASETTGGVAAAALVRDQRPSSGKFGGLDGVSIRGNEPPPSSPQTQMSKFGKRTPETSGMVNDEKKPRWWWFPEDRWQRL